MKLTVALLVAAVMSAAAGSAANAATVTFSTSTGPLAGSTVETFDSMSNPINGASASFGTVSTTGNASVVSGSLSGQYAAPNPGPVDSTPYLSVFGGGSATFTLSQPASYLGLLWGSVDTYNSISFLGAGDAVLATFTGANFASHNGDQSINGTYYANFISSIPFLKVVLSSTSNSFEVDNVAVSAVPLPAALPLFGAALAGMGAFGRKRRKAKLAA